jgi:hypothetical protein
VATPGGRGTVCTWTTAQGSLLGVQVYEGEAFFAPDVQAPTGQRLTDLGDAAYVDVHDGVGGALLGDVVVVVDTVGPGTHDVVEDLLRTAVGHT